ncbi:MAG: hypothetical protein IJ856_02610, partial [Candidatus Methanomethylophilaceae archaeon]|nr:hypothetical protein [Candidatus Methanomethylophilaceae archaeon]
TERYEIKSISGNSYSVDYTDDNGPTTKTMSKSKFLEKVRLTPEQIEDLWLDDEGIEYVDTAWGQVKCTKYTGIMQDFYIGSNDVLYKYVTSSKTKTLSATSLL